MTGVNMVRIPYKGGGPALNDVIAGQVKLMFAAGTAVPPHIKAGRLRGLAVTSAAPTALYPGLPTVAASGVPGYETSSILAMFAPARTPTPIIKRLNDEIVRVLNRADVKETFFNAGAETVASTPEQLTATMKSEIVKWSKVIKAVGKLE
jgi:tripartite-type tricarboxylate transporter receptor subunit TctC